MISEQLNELRENRLKLKEVYHQCKPRCFAFMIKCFGHQNMDDTKMFTIFNDAVIVLSEKIADPSFQLTCTIQVYLNSVCRNIALNYFKVEKKLYKTTDQDLENLDYDKENSDVLEDPSFESPYEIAIQKAFEVIKNSGGHCAEILAMFWYQKASMEEIAEKFGYTNSSNAKNQKARCQKRLKDTALQLVKI